MYLYRARVLRKIIAESSGSTIAENEFEITITEKHRSFMHGGEPHFTFPTTVGPTSQPLGAMSPATPTMAQYPSSYPPSTPISTPSLTAPHVIGPSSAVATPPASHFSPAAPLQYGTPGGLGKALFGPEVQLSGKHNGLCLYLARLLG